MSPGDTIFALSSGQPPAGIAVMRISGPEARAALQRLCGKVPPPRQAVLTTIAEGGEILDRGLVLFFPAPRSVTGQDVAELHLHGGRAVVQSVSDALSRMPGFRAAEGGEFTRRALENGRIDLTEAEGLADLLEAETASQRRAALLLSGGALARQVDRWTARLLALSAEVEALLDFSDEDDVDQELPSSWYRDHHELVLELESALTRPSAERLKDGIRVVIAGPPNAGKSTLLNTLVGRSAAITSSVPGTTRDLVEVPVAIDGVPFLLIDSAGLRETDDPVEAIGVERAEGAMARADILIWLGAPTQAPNHEAVMRVHSKADLGQSPDGAELSVSAATGEGMKLLTGQLLESAAAMLPREGEVALHRRHQGVLGRAYYALADAGEQRDLLIVAEALREARLAFDEVTGRAGLESMLDTLFGRFCIGK